MSPGKRERGRLDLLQPPPAPAPRVPLHPPAAPPAETQTPVQQTPEVRTTEVQTPEAAEPRARRRSQARPSASPPRTPAPSPGLPKYLRLERKELLIWPDQITNLSVLARVLNRNRGGAGERITTNTLIRVAASLLLSRAQDLEGTTEEELRRSLGLPDLQTPDLRSLRKLRLVILECMADNRSHTDRILVARLSGAAGRLSRWGALDDAQADAGAAELRELAGGRGDLLAEVAGLSLGSAESKGP